MNFKSSRALQLSQGKGLLLMLIALIITATEVFAQDYTLELNQRRMGDQLGVEFWLRRDNSSAKRIASLSMAVTYNTALLQPASTSGYAPQSTDSILTSLEGSSAYVPITSPFHSADGFAALGAQASNDGTNYVYGLNASLTNPGAGEVAGNYVDVGTAGKGTFVGMLVFDIINHSSLTASDSANFELNTLTSIGKFELLGYTGLDTVASLTDGNLTLVSVPNIAIRGIDILNPNGPLEAVNRDKQYTFMSVAGYPLYFERSGLITPSATKRYGTAEELAYEFSYSTDANNTSWTEFMRVAETRDAASVIGAANLINYRNGEVTNTTGSDVAPTAGYYITQADGSQLPVGSGDGYGGILRVIWDDDTQFAGRSERAKLRILQLAEATTTDSIANRSDGTVYGISDDTFILSRLFFLYFDGAKYLKTDSPIDYHTELTLEAWVNVSDIKTGTGSETGIISLAGENSDTEGVAMLYLAEGKYPAFRVRESVGGVGRGENDGDYIATLVSPDALSAVADVVPIDGNLGHSANWRHIAGVLDKNVLSLYVDGELVDKYTNTNTTDISPVDNNGGGTGGHYIWIGINPNGDTDNTKYFEGGIKEARMWRDALTQSDIRTQMSGVTTPATVASTSDIRYGLRAYYSFKGVKTDLASHVKSSGDQSNQEGADVIGWYEGDPNDPTALTNELYPYRPDMAHMRIVSPSANDGVKNLSGSTFEVRWASYGVGDEANTSSDMLLQFSRDGGSTWAYAVDEAGLLLDDIDVEVGSDDWEPYRSATTVGAYNDLQAVAPGDSNYSKSVMLRLAGTSANNQTGIADTTEAFELAPYFVLENTGENSIIEVDRGKAMNLLGGEAVFEAWVSPYRLPSATEVSFPIITKADTVTGDMHYSMKILSSGQLQFDVGTTAGDVLSAVSSADNLVIPNAQSSDTTWTHLAVYASLGNGTSAPTIKMYVDGNVQTNVTGSLVDATSVTVDDTNEFPTFIGWYSNSSGTQTLNGSFIGAIKGVRYWNASPGGSATSGSEPTALTLFMQGVANVQASELLEAARTNLIASFDFDGGAVSADGYVYNSVYSVINGATDSLAAKVIVNNGVKYTAVKPFLKLVEPVASQKIKESDNDVKVRWIGFNYDKDGFGTGDLATSKDSYLEWSSNGGSHYEPTSSDNDGLASFTEDAFSLPLTSTYKFPGTNPPLVQFAGNLSATYTKSNFTDSEQNTYPVSAIDDAQLQIAAEATINAATGYDYLTWSTLRDQTSNFTVTAKSNFTLRVLLEGYHRGSGTAFSGRLGPVWDDGALKISIFNDQGGQPATTARLVDTSDADYIDKNPFGSPEFGSKSRTNDGARFGDVEFVFSELEDSTYFVLVEHRNHLPVLSRYAVPFVLTGDDASTWGIESGWDFQMWDGDNTDSISASNAAALTMGTSFAAWGPLETDASKTDYGRTGLHYNNGLTVDTASGLAGMVAGDVIRDGQILGSDIALISLDVTSQDYRSDITGDSLVDADDRTIVDRNFFLNASVTDIIAWDSLYNDAASQGIMIDDTDDQGIFNDLYVGGIEYSRELNKRANHILAHPEKYRSRVAKAGSKSMNSLQGSEYEFDIYAESEFVEGTDYVEVSFYLENRGRPWAPGHCTFAINYDNNLFTYLSLEGATSSLWAKDPSNVKEEDKTGYRGIYSGPTTQTLEPTANVRTVEIDFDNRLIYSPDLGKAVKQNGTEVPYEKELVATLRFEIRNPEAGTDFVYDWNNVKVWDTDGNQITAFGEKHLDGSGENPADPTPAMITYPNGGEVWKAGEKAVVYWTKSGDVPLIELEISLDGGGSWFKLNASAIDLLAGKFDYSVDEKFESGECLVRMVDAVTRNEIDRSDNMFTIKIPQNFVTQPSSASPIFYGGEISTIKWIVDTPSAIRFEFSRDGLTKGTEVVPVANSQTSQAEWKVPSGINTDRAVITMFDLETNAVLAQSSPFRVLAGKLAITSPSAGQVIDINNDENATVRWESDNVAQFDLQFSPDGGATWVGVENSVNALTYNYNWLVNRVDTETAVLRALYRGNENLEYSRSGIFSINVDPSGIDNLPSDIFFASVAYPNPFDAETKLTFVLANTEKVTAKVYNSAGLEMLTLHENEMLFKGSHELSISAENMTSGVYYLRISAGANEITREIVVLK
jgi:Concanavalin A-like lectin/glucanases superfamily/Secretion system C-terminal sorting domain